MNKSQTNSPDGALRNLDGMFPDLEALYNVVISGMCGAAEASASALTIRSIAASTRVRTPAS